jgi:lysophospholipase L1-like esterase
MLRTVIASLVALVFALPVAQAQSFTCGPTKAPVVALSPATLVSTTTAGFDLNSTPTVAGGVCSSDKPFYFSVPLTEGNYRVTVVLGGSADSVVTVRAEARRLMIEKLAIPAKKSVTRTFDVNLRVADFTKPDGTAGRVRLKPREIGNLDWDAKLTLEFNGTNPSLRSITIEPLTGAKAEPTIYLAGDSTMVDQDIEPWASWGQMLPRFFGPGIVIANHAESGESSSSFVSEQRFAKIMSLIKPGDYFFVQFAHNDQKNGPDFPARYHTIMTDFITQVRAKGATPVIVTAMNRDQFDADGHIIDSLEPYPQTAREVAAATGTTLIDLNAMSKILFEAMGHPGADRAFMHFAANTFPGQTEAINDNTHFNNYGAYELARCIVHGIREAKHPSLSFSTPRFPTSTPPRQTPSISSASLSPPCRRKKTPPKFRRYRNIAASCSGRPTHDSIIVMGGM